MVDQIEFIRRMRVRIHDQLAAMLFRQPHMQIAQIGPRWRSVMLHRNPQARRGRQQLGKVDLVGLTLEHLSAGGVPEDVDVRIFSGTQYARRHLLARLIESRVHTGDHNIQLRKRRVVKIERTVQQNINLNPSKDAEGN